MVHKVQPVIDAYGMDTILIRPPRRRERADKRKEEPTALHAAILPLAMPQCQIILRLHFHEATDGAFEFEPAVALGI